LNRLKFFLNLFYLVMWPLAIYPLLFMSRALIVVMY